MADLQKQKQNSAQEAIKYVQEGMTLGLGTGSTADCFVKLLAQKEFDVKCVCTSRKTKKLAMSLGLRVFSFDDVKKIDLAVDGADVIASNKNLIKGYGGALTREKIIEYTAEKFIVIADSTKLAQKLAKPVPIEYLPFAKRMVKKGLTELGAKNMVDRLESEMPFYSDNNFHIIDADFGTIANPRALEEQINHIPGVLENGIFSRPVFKVILGTDDGVKEL